MLKNSQATNRKVTLKEPIHFFDTATAAKQEFVPLKEGVATMYSCGPTVYDHAHLGNLSAYLLPDLIKRVLVYNGYQVNHTINFTDFGHLTDDGDAGEDKMMKALKREGLPITLANMKLVAEKYITSFKADLSALGIISPNQYTPASEFVSEQITLIADLHKIGAAYETSDGVYFDISQYPEYGRLGSVELKKLQAGVRVKANPEKRQPADFALWKKGDLGWESDWGKGFPGWHTECTAMIFATLGQQIDIHTGGQDLMYTHHNGEIAQAETITKKPYVGYWLHNALMTMGGEKFAKSAGNGIRLIHLEERGYSPTDYRYLLLTAHHQTPINFTYESLDGAKTARRRLLQQLINQAAAGEGGAVNPDYQKIFHRFINDNLDTPQALATLWQMMKDSALKPADKLATARQFDQILGLGIIDIDIDIEAGGEGARGEVSTLPSRVQDLLERREAARVEQNWPEADRLRAAIKDQGYQIEDSETGPIVTRA